MGGAKKRSITRMQRQQQKRGQTAKRAKPKSPEKKIGGIDIPDIGSKDIIGELSKLKAITPYEVASKYKLRLSIAKDLLEKLEKQGIIAFVAGNSRLKIYRWARA